MLFCPLCLSTVLFANFLDEVYIFQVHFGSSRYEMRIPVKEFDNIPKWNTNELEPPLPIGKAIFFAKRWLKSSNHEPEILEKIKLSFKGGRYDLIDARLRPLLNDTWVYIVHFEELGPPGLALQGGEKHIEIVVDFNGVVHFPSSDQLKKPIERDE